MSKKTNRPWKVFAAILLAIAFGSWAGQDKGIFGVSFFTILSTFGSIFLNALTLIVVPLVSSSIISGIARIGSEQSFGRIGGKTFLFYLGTSLMAILIGLFFVNLLHPGDALNISSLALPGQEGQVSLLESRAETNGLLAFFNVLAQIVPANIVDILSTKQMLGLIFFSLLFGYSLSKIDSHHSSLLQSFWQGIFQTMLRITHMIMRFLPFGVFCLVGKVFATTGIGSLASLGMFALAVLLGLASFMFIGLPLLLKFVGRVSPIRHFKAMSPAIITAFSTSSSSATLPITIDCVEKRAGVSNRVCSLVVPLGTSINMSGSALYECVAAMFVAQAYGIHLTFATQFLLVLLSLVTSIGVAGIPSGSLVAIVVILRTLGLPPEGIGLFIAVDRLLDMCRTTVNVFSDSCCAILVARTEGEHVLVKDPETISS
jgi:Na+/H+-dicarboxylate symporter